MYDVIVVGARCAGAASAMLLARAGHRVLVVDRASFPSDTLSTHLLKPRAMAYLRRWGLRDHLDAASTPVHSAFVFQRDGIQLAGAPTVEALARCQSALHGYDAEQSEIEIACVRRFVLDDILVRAAVEAGAELRENCAAEGLLWDDGRVVGVRLRTAGGVVEERARVVVGADGRRSRMRQWVDAAVFARSDRCTYTVYSYYSGIPECLSRPGVYLNGRLGVGLGATNNGLTMVSVFGPGEWFGDFSVDMEGNLLRSVEICFPELEPTMRQPGGRSERVAGTTDLANVMHAVHGPGWLLVGDAACHLDQCTAIGITHAFRDAALAAQQLSQGLTGEATLDAALETYAARRDAEMRPQFEYVSTVSECNLSTTRQLAFLAGLQRDEAALARFLGFGAAIVPRSDYFTEAETDELVAEGRPWAPSDEEWALRARTHLQNPWVATSP